jgi:hypothetical protein
MTIEEFVKWDVKDGMVTLHGHELLIVKGRGDHDGALATQDQYENFQASFAHAFADGRVMRFGNKIAALDALTILSREEHGK